MREQSAGLGLTVSQRFDSRQQADQAVQQLRQAGFREEDVRVWQHRKLAPGYEDRLARTFEGFLAGGVIGGLLGFFLTVAITWADSQTISMEATPGATIVAAAVGAVVVAILVNIISTKFSFSPGHGHGAHDEPPSVVTVRAGDKEADARRVFSSMSSASSHGH